MDPFFHARAAALHCIYVYESYSESGFIEQQLIYYFWYQQDWALHTIWWDWIV